MKTKTLTLCVVAVALLPAVVFAAEPCADNAVGYQTASYQHEGTPVMPAPPAHRFGKYVLQTRRVVVPGHYESRQTERCYGNSRYTSYRFGRRCVTQTTQVWVPSYNRTVSQWVWVDTHDRRPGYRNGYAQNAYYR